MQTHSVARYGVTTKLLISLLLITLTCLNQAHGLEQSPILMAYSIERNGDFLVEPGNFPIEALRRFGRGVNTLWPDKQKKIVAASRFEPTLFNTPQFFKPVAKLKLTPKQQKEAQQLLDRHSNECLSLLGELSQAKEAFMFQFAGESETLKNAFLSLADSDSDKTNITPQQAAQIKAQLIPFLESADYIIGAAVVSAKGFEARLRIKHDNNDQTSLAAAAPTISIGKYINPENLMYFVQTHAITDPEEAMQNLAQIPQTKSVIEMVASVGLDFKNDLLANSAQESLLYINLAPDSQTGIPDISFIAPVPDPKKLEGNLDKLKQLCTQLGIFVKIHTEDSFKLVELSYFMFPQYQLFTGLVNEMLLISTSKSSLLKEMNHIAKVKSSQKQTLNRIDEFHRYWKIGFTDLNRQLQMLLQSPLLRDQGIPPIPNLTLLADMDDLTITNKISTSQIDFSLTLPVAVKK